MPGRPARGFSRGSHLLGALGPPLPAAPLERSYLALAEAPESQEAHPNSQQQHHYPLGSPGFPLRLTFSSFASNDFGGCSPSSPLAGGGNPRRGMFVGLFSRVPLWCESLLWWALPLLLFAFLFLSYSAFCLLLPRAPPQDYGIVIDAGSHGSRVNIFHWDSRVYDPHNPLTGPVSVPQLAVLRVYSPGVGEAFESPEQGQKQLLQMIRDASAALAALGVEASRWFQVPIYLKATAGMRTMSQERRDAIMELVRQTLRDKRLNPFHFKDDFARVISGEEEGVYGWVAVNSARNSLGAPPEETLGALDMGGSSAQITFSPFYTSILEDFNALHLGNTSLRLYSHSFLGYGWADALARVNLRLVSRQLPDIHRALSPQQPGGLAARLVSPFQRQVRARRGLSGGPKAGLKVPIEHPCFPRGHSFYFTLPAADEEGLRLYADLGPPTLEQFLLLLGIPKRDRDKLVAAAALDGLRDRHELQDAEGQQAAHRKQSGAAAAGPPDRQADGGGPPKTQEGGPQTAAAQALRAQSRGGKVKVKFKGNGDFEKCHALASQ